MKALKFVLLEIYREYCGDVQVKVLNVSNIQVIFFFFLTTDEETKPVKGEKYL